MSNRTIIVGAGDFGRELYYWFSQAYPDSTVDGFIDDNLTALDGYNMAKPILSKISDHTVQKDTNYLMGISEPETKLKLASLLMERGITFSSFIDPTVVISGGVALGQGVVLCPYSVVSCHATIGDFCAVNLHSTVGHDVVLGEGATLSAHVDVCGHAQIGKGVFLGSHACVLPKVKVGNFARIGAGSVVMTRVKEDTTVFGPPAKKM